MNNTTYPHTLRTTQSPELEAASTGVVIRVPARSSLGESCVVHGSFRIPACETGSLRVGIHRAIVLVVTSRFAHFTLEPFRSFILFSDDVREAGGVQEGAFAVELAQCGIELPPGEHFVMASIGESVSNVSRIVIT